MPEKKKSQRRRGGLGGAERSVRESNHRCPERAGHHFGVERIGPGCPMGVRADRNSRRTDLAADGCDGAAGGRWCELLRDS